MVLPVPVASTLDIQQCKKKLKATRNPVSDGLMDPRLGHDPARWQDFLSKTINQSCHDFQIFRELDPMLGHDLARLQDFLSKTINQSCHDFQISRDPTLGHDPARCKLSRKLSI
jgi:hypothetical protein